MKQCPKCNAQLDDNAQFCNNCGTPFNQQQPNQQPPYQQAQTGAPVPPQPVVNQYDHTSEFDPRDVADNKLFALLVYVMDIVGVIVALLAKTSSNSPYIAFHIKQSLKYTIVEFLLGFISIFLFWTCIAPIFAGVMGIIIFVLKIISFVQTASGKSVEPAIIRSLNFLK